MDAGADFAALDFETADERADSACAVGVVRVTAGRIEEVAYRLVRPPRHRVRFTHVHGLRWADVCDEPTFADVWPALAPLLAGTRFIAAHYAPFDRRVLHACCDAAGLPAPAQPFLCTVRLARRVWDIRPTRLSNVCQRLRIPLRHHHAESDARACAAIVLAALRDGTEPDTLHRCLSPAPRR